MTRSIAHRNHMTSVSDLGIALRLMRPLYDGTMLIATVAGAAATVITFALQARSF